MEGTIATATSHDQVTPPAGEQGSAIALREVTKRYGDGGPLAVAGVSLDIAPGELIVLLGASGCGKTTLLKMINRLIEPTSGSIAIDSVDALSLPGPALRRTIGYVIQQAGLFPHMRVEDNIAVVPRLLKWDKGAIATRVRELLDLVGLPPERYARRYPTQLSGGEQQRVGLARALAAQPRTLLMDEPIGALDAITRRRLQNELIRIHRQLRPTIVFVTHDVDEAMRLADRVAVMNEGQVIQIGTALEVLTTPASDFVARLVGAGDVVRRLGLIPVTAALDERRDVAPGSATIGAEASLRDALNRLVSEHVDSLTVVDTSDEVVGVVTLESLRAAASGESSQASPVPAAV